jgi:diguanylate cyclase
MDEGKFSDLEEPARSTASPQHVRASQALLVLVVYGVFAGVQHVEVLLGLIDERQSWLLTAYNLAGGTLFYGVIRSGLNLRFRGDPSLTIPQSLWALGGISCSYAITGPARGAVLLIVVLVLMFGIFALTPRQSRVLAGVGFAMLGSAMVYKGWIDPIGYDPRVEGIHLVFAAVIVAAVAVLAERLGRLRARLQRQKHDLSQALERIQALATRDELTGLINRRAVLDDLRAECRRRDRAAPNLCLGLIDLDHFKRINDGIGHAAGDRVLRRFADIAMGEVRMPDRMARWGGEEFLLVMPGTDEAEGAACLARVQARLAAVAFDDIAPGLRVSFSAGIAACAADGDFEQALERADKAMYEAKRRGRDRTVRASQLEAEARAPQAAAVI